MKSRWVIAFTLVISVIVIIVCVWAFGTTKNESVDLSEVNKIIQNGEKYIEDMDNFVPITSEYLYSIYDNNSNLLYGKEENEHFSVYARQLKAVDNGDIFLPLQKEGNIKGYILIYVNNFGLFDKNVNLMKSVFYGIIAFQFIIIVGYLIYLQYYIFQPFYKMRQFAAEVSKGNLDIPLKVNRHQNFGVFEESFDIMRLSLKQSRERERQAEESKKQLIAEISHDIKTPLSSIRAIAECAELKTKNEWCEKIIAKVNQTERLISEIYNSTLEDLGELKVNCNEVNSNKLAIIFEKSDYNKRCTIKDIPPCVIYMDKFRFGQIADNIISNSYKYADTEILIDFRLEEKYLTIIIRDYGEGIKKEELAYITNKFYRGEKVYAKSGEGLGLYISKQLMEKQNGELMCYNDNGFVVELKLLRIG